MARHPRIVLFGWVVAIALGAVGAHKLPTVAIGGTAGIPGSPSIAASDALRTEFSNPFIDPLVIAVSAPRLSVDQAPYLAWVRTAARVLGALPSVRRVADYPTTHDAQMRSADGHVTLLLVGLSSTDKETEQRAVVQVREAVAPLRAELLRLDASSQVAVTGGPAADFDVNAWSATGGDHAEKHALPLTLIILLMAFGTLVAAGLPFLMGLATTTVSLGIAFLIAELVPVSNLLSNVVTMIGLAIGIDYSLLMVTHYRENRGRGTVAEAVADTVARAGQTIAWSGVTVMIGFFGLLFSPILETRCAGIGGALVVCVSVLAALTLLPAALVLLGPYIDRWSVVPPRLRLGNTTAALAAARRMDHPSSGSHDLLVSGLCVIALASPPAQGEHGGQQRALVPAARDRIPRRRRDIEHAVAATTPRSRSMPSCMPPTAHRSSPRRTSRRCPSMRRGSRGDPRIASVASPFSLQKGFGAAQYSALYRNPEEALRGNPQIAELYVSKDRTGALFQITPADSFSVKKIEALARDLGKIAPQGPFTVAIAGNPAEHNDFSDYMFRSLPKIVGFVVGATLIMLFFAFRSYLLPIEAVLMNLLAVAAGIGAVVAVFQLGWLNGLVGLERPFVSIPLEVPMMVFCLSFGLSMDYELFLLFRIKRAYEAERDNDKAIVSGLVAVAPVITGAGLIMAVVFGAFVGAELPVLKMMGVGLCVAVLVDATVIRTFVVPAVMAIGGRFNWYPG